MSKRFIPRLGKFTKIQIESFMKMKLKENDKWVKRACVALYDHQTDLEKKNHISNKRNNWGFNRVDTPLLTHIACKIKQHRETAEDIEMLHNKIPKYARQLICISYEKDNGKLLLIHLNYYYRNDKSKMPF